MIALIFEIFATFADTMMLVWFVTKILGASLREKPWTIFIPIAQFSVQIFFDHIMPGFSLLPMMIMLLFVFAFAMVLSPKTVWWNALTAIAYISLMMLVSTFLYSIFSFLIENMAEILQGSNTKVRILYLSIAKLLLFFVYKLVLVLFKKDRSIETPSAIMSLILTFSTIIALSAIMNISAIVVTDDINIPVLVLAFSLLAGNIVLYLFIYQIQKLQRSKYELKLMNERIAHEAKQAEEANTIWNNIRKVRHDLKNHFSVIRGYAERGENDACLDYLNSIQQTVESMGTLIRSGNSVIDYMINSKLSVLEGVEVVISGYVGSFYDISDADMVCILGNILDNAVEAVVKTGKEKRIELYFSKINKNRLIICKNTVDAPVLKNNKHLLSTKTNKEAHGIGHQIVEATVKKYGGLVDYFEEDGFFGIEISLPEPIQNK